MVEQWWSINEIAKELHIPETTVRRYISTFKEYFSHQAKQFGRGKKYPEQAAHIIKTIYNSYRTGKSTDEIRGLLNIQYKQVIDIEPVNDFSHDSKTMPVDQNTIHGIIEKNNELVRQNTDALKQIAEILTRVLDQEEVIRELRNEIRELKEQKNKSFFKRIFK